MDAGAGTCIRTNLHMKHNQWDMMFDAICEIEIMDGTTRHEPQCTAAQGQMRCSENMVAKSGCD